MQCSELVNLMKSALIGYSGFVGTTLLKQRSFDSLYRSTNIRDIEGGSFDTVVCAAASAKKWVANKNPEEDILKINGLIECLKSITCKTFILISTVDVFSHPIEIDEESEVNESGLHPYGLHRRILERFVELNFPEHLVVRLPGLVGPGLRKNVIFDLLNGNNVQSLESRSEFQFYPMINLWFDVQIALEARLKLVHLTAEPITVSEVAALGFGSSFDRVLPGTPSRYDFRTRHAGLFGTENSFYQYTKRETLQAIRGYAQSEPITVRQKAD